MFIIHSVEHLAFTIGQTDKTDVPPKTQPLAGEIKATQTGAGTARDVEGGSAALGLFLSLHLFPPVPWGSPSDKTLYAESTAGIGQLVPKNQAPVAQPGVDRMSISECLTPAF